MVILILIDAEYLQNATFSFEKSSNGQNQSPFYPHHLIKTLSKAKFRIPALNWGWGWGFRTSALGYSCI